MSAGEFMIAWLNKLKPWQVLIILSIVGLTVFATGLHGQFQGDDIGQIVDNTAVHSVKNIGEFFSASTFDSDSNSHQLSNAGYYRPVMTTLYSVIYTIFGPNPIAFHVLQLFIYICSAFLLFLLFRYYLGAALALIVTLVFLVSPINSQVVYSIPCLQDALYMFFGLLALWILLAYDSTKSLVFVALCLFLSMLSKEAGFIFVVMAIVYLSMFFRRQLPKFLGIMVIPILVYLVMWGQAVGSGVKSVVAPIDTLKFADRLITMPSIVFFYFTKFVFPWKLSTAWYWTYTSFSVAHVLIPLVVDLAVVGVFIYAGKLVCRKAPKDLFDMYIFFGIWAAVGMVVYLQFIPLDMTACETWFCFSMIGILGMIGIFLRTYPPSISATKFLIIVATVLLVLGIRSAARGLDYSSQVKLAMSDVSVSSQDYLGYSILANYSQNAGLYKLAIMYAKLSVRAYPSPAADTTLGEAYFKTNNYPGAYKGYYDCLNHDPTNQSCIEDLGQLMLVYGNTKTDQQYLSWALSQRPQDSKLWEYQALFDREQGNITGARVAIKKAAVYGKIQVALYNDVVTNKPFVFPFQTSAVKIK